MSIEIKRVRGDVTHARLGDPEGGVIAIVRLNYAHQVDALIQMQEDARAHRSAGLQRVIAAAEGKGPNEKAAARSRARKAFVKHWLEPTDGTDEIMRKWALCAAEHNLSIEDFAAGLQATLMCDGKKPKEDERDNLDKLETQLATEDRAYRIDNVLRAARHLSKIGEVNANKMILAPDAFADLAATLRDLDGETPPAEPADHSNDTVAAEPTGAAGPVPPWRKAVNVRELPDGVLREMWLNSEIGDTVFAAERSRRDNLRQLTQTVISAARRASEARGWQSIYATQGELAAAMRALDGAN